MLESLLFLLGFSSIVSIYEVAKSGKSKRTERELLKMTNQEIRKKRK